LPSVDSFYASPLVAAAGSTCGSRWHNAGAASGRQVEVLATNRLDDPIDASPVAVGRQLFLRGERYLYCVEGK